MTLYFAKRGFGWAANPWVIVIGFKPHLRNVGDMEARKGTT